MAMQSDKWRGTWGGDKAPLVLPGLHTADGQEIETSYVDENGQTWLVEAYDVTTMKVPVLPILPARIADVHWRASLVDARNAYGEDVRYPTVSGSSSEYQAVLGIDAFARSWKMGHAKELAPSGGSGWLLGLIVIAYLAFGDKRR